MSQINDQSDKSIYEVGYHILPTVDESLIPTQLSNMRSLIEGLGGAVISEEMPKMTALSYEIAKNVNSKAQRFNRAYFGWTKFESDPSKIADIKNKIEGLADILRFIIVKTVRENTMHVPKIPMFKKEIRKEEKETENAEKPKASEAEIDKSIDELIVDQTL